MGLRQWWFRRQAAQFERDYQATIACGRSPEGHDYEWFCVMCDRADPCHCGLRSLFQRCKKCGKRGPNGGY